MPYNIICNLFSSCIMLNSTGIWKTNMWYNQGIFKDFLECCWIFEYFREKSVFTAWQACKDIWQISQNNYGIPWPKTFQSFGLAEEKNKIVCRRKRVSVFQNCCFSKLLPTVKCTEMSVQFFLHKKNESGNFSSNPKI